MQFLLSVLSLSLLHIFFSDKFQHRNFPFFLERKILRDPPPFRDIFMLLLAVFSSWLLSIFGSVYYRVV